MADADPAHLRKLADDRLRAFATAAPDERISVFVEVAGPPQVEVAMEERPGLGQRPSLRSVPGEPADTAPSALVREVEALLIQQTGRQPVWIGAARAFVVDASAEQLLCLVESPLVRRISRNRRLG